MRYRGLIAAALLASGAAARGNPVYRRIYQVTFEDPWGDAPRESVKLVVVGDKARRGFEWRFKED